MVHEDYTYAHTPIKWCMVSKVLIMHMYIMKKYGLNGLVLFDSIIIIVLSQTGNYCCLPSAKDLPTSMMTMTTISPIHTRFVLDI